MAIQVGKKKASKHDAHDMKQQGADVTDPTRASKPAQPTYLYPLARELAEGCPTSSMPMATRCRSPATGATNTAARRPLASRTRRP